MYRAQIHKLIHSRLIKTLHRLEVRVERALDETGEPEVFSFEWLLGLLSTVYGVVTGLRVWLYEKRILNQRTLPCYVISVGNIVAGGAGKTPMAICLAKTLGKMGKKSVVISRGYKGTYKEAVLVVSDGDHVFTDAQTCGDEPYMMAKRKLFPVLVGKDRFTAGQKAIQMFDPDVIILDDGFQHLGLKRDLDLLLFDYSDPLGNRRLLPSGRLRESLNMASKRAHSLIFTRCPDINFSFKKGLKDPAIQEVTQQFESLPWFKTTHDPFVCSQIRCGRDDQQQMANMENLKGKKAVLFSGIAKNDSFYQSMAAWGVNILDHLEFQDHYRYKEADFERINLRADELGAEIILTTEKDNAKLMPDIEWIKDFLVIGIRIRFEMATDFELFLKKKMGSE